MIEEREANAGEDPVGVAAELDGAPGECAATVEEAVELPSAPDEGPAVDAAAPCRTAPAGSTINAQITTTIGSTQTPTRTDGSFGIVGGHVSFEYRYLIAPVGFVYIPP